MQTNLWSYQQATYNIITTTNCIYSGDKLISTHIRESQWKFSIVDYSHAQTRQNNLPVLVASFMLCYRVYDGKCI